jgi:UPF0288 family protein (methanogenesis marker protein 3)
MRVYVNGQEVHIVTGMTVRHALIAVGLLHDIESGKKVYDEKENEIGLGGAPAEGSRIYVK